MYHDNNNYNAPGQFDQGSGTYHYSYTAHEVSRPEGEKSPKKKGRVGMKMTALVLSCALVGGGAGVGGAALYGAITGGGSNGGETVIYRNETDPTPVKVNSVDGLTPMTLSEINAAYADSCVCITVEATIQQGYYQYRTSGSGSGFIISEDGYIVTNYHVIDGATAIKVTLNNGESYDANLVGGEELNDVAVLKIDGISGLKPVVLGDSSDLVVGDTVCTIGNALGTLSFSLTSGAVSATGRSITMSDGTVMNMIQTDCTINSGNSGGPLFDSYGRVVGITSAKYSNNGDSSSATIEGIGFAIPINDVVDIITDFMEYGYVTGRPYMGVVYPTTVSEENKQAFGWPNGVYINDVESGSCAETAGIRRGDIITKIDDTDITDVSQMVSVKNSYRASDTVTITVYRAGEYLELTLTFDEQVNTQTDDSQGQQDPTQQDPTQQDPTYQDPYGGNNYFNPWDYFFGR